ncbi:molybdenum ABC transporter ATP-binding protein [Pseudaminobacter salicylatoxidans]|uniref:molybdenum ABC transporter ATP-binding protein n=1 Tax=Pseudaminobacter salicylatoxidans TaxID=93369 RepID=UPI00030519F3|nr:molybdenum ABC transporter ATP-binding protein [Pseudaminobacter salicylatoxidans]
MTVSVDISQRLGSLTLEARFESAGRLTALFGPSGSGKTSLINLIGGLMRPDRGRITAQGRVFVDTAERIFVPAHKRRVGYVFQEPRLFPHMSVRTNLLYGRWFTPSAERYEDLGRVVELLGIGHLLERRPSRLSGGEKQRVAIGRALLTSPRLLLMDEPLASLDEARKAEIMPYIERLRDETKIPIVYVSHSIGEVARLASDVAVMSQGKLSAFGPTGTIMQRLDLLPKEAQGEGGAVLDMQVAAHDREFDMTVLASRAGEIRVPRIDAGPGNKVRVRIRARDVIIATERPQGLSALNMLAGTIAAIQPADGVAVEVRIDCGGEAVMSRITRQSLHALDLAVGRPVFAVIKTVAFDQENLSRTGALHDI